MHELSGPHGSAYDTCTLLAVCVEVSVVAAVPQHTAVVVSMYGAVAVAGSFVSVVAAVVVSM